MITQAEVRRLFDYREDGRLVRAISTAPRAMKGMVAGTVSGTRHKFINIKISYISYKAHRLVFLWHHGYLPDRPMVIDHINRDSLDNRIENLRGCTLSENNYNSYRSDPRIPRIPEYGK